MLLGVVEGNALLQVESGRGELATPDQGVSERKVRLYRRSVGSCTLWAKLQELLRQLTRGLVLRPHMIKRP